MAGGSGLATVGTTTMGLLCPTTPTGTINEDAASDIDIECAVGDIEAKIEARSRAGNKNCKKVRKIRVLKMVVF